MNAIEQAIEALQAARMELTGCRIETKLADAEAALQSMQEEAVYAFRRKGLDDFCTCSKPRYDELAQIDRFEVAVFYTHPQSPAVPDGYSLIANEILDRFPELNMSNYSHDDVDALNAWGVELTLSASQSDKGE